MTRDEHSNRGEGFYLIDKARGTIMSMDELDALVKEHDRLRDAVIATAKVVRDQNVKWEEDMDGDCARENLPDELVEACIELCAAYDNLEAHERKASG